MAIRPNAGEFVVVYRYTNRRFSQASRLARVGVLTRLRERFLMQFRAYRLWRADAHSAGLTKNSPFISVLLEPVSVSSSRDAGVRAIVTGLPEWALQAYGLQQAEDIGVFRVPISRLYSPNPARITQHEETERLFLGDDLIEFLLEWRPNPYLRRQ